MSHKLSSTDMLNISKEQEVGAFFKCLAKRRKMNGENIIFIDSTRITFYFTNFTALIIFYSLGPLSRKNTNVLWQKNWQLYKILYLKYYAFFCSCIYPPIPPNQPPLDAKFTAYQKCAHIVRKNVPVLSHPNQ